MDGIVKVLNTAMTTAFQAGHVAAAKEAVRLASPASTLKMDQVTLKAQRASAQGYSVSWGFTPLALHAIALHFAKGPENKATRTALAIAIGGDAVSLAAQFVPARYRLAGTMVGSAIGLGAGVAGMAMFR
jgi:hypothetical protein